MAKKKLTFTNLQRGFILGELKRFITIINKYFPESKEKKEILNKFEELKASIETYVGGSK